MSDPSVERGEKRAAQVLAATWYVDEYLGTIIWARNPFGSGDDFRVADIRGWGHLTGQGALRMDPSAGEITQMALATHIVNCHNNRADLAAERERDLLKQAADCVPTNWLDPLLTGPDAVIPRNVDGRAIEALLRGVQDRIRLLAKHEQENQDDER